jgi:AcrR family transcriptional regulator
MGLREINADRTQRMIVGAALELIYERGYDGATMEGIAQRAGIGVSTLYRYFPTKETLIVSPLGDPSMMAEALRERPPEESAEVALGHALIVFLGHTNEVPEQSEQLRKVLEENPRPRARLMEWFVDTHAQLVLALQERLEGPDAELRAGAMAWTVVWVLQRTKQLQQQDGAGAPNLVDIAKGIMASLAQYSIPTPRVED